MTIGDFAKWFVENHWLWTGLLVWGVFARLAGLLHK